MYRSILVPLDGSPWSEYALRTATLIAQAAQATLHVVHVHISQYTTLPGTIPLLNIRVDQEQHNDEKAYLERVAQQLKPQDVQLVTALIEGPVAAALGDYVGQHAIDLVVMTTHGRGALAQLWFGGVADQLVRSLPAPIVLLHPDSETQHGKTEVPLHHILIPLDLSELSEHIIEHAIAVGSLTGARYTLLHVVEQSPRLWAEELSTLAMSEQAIAEAQHAATRYLEGIANDLSERIPHICIAVEVGRPGEVIPMYAQQHDVDMIAMATHGRSGFIRMYLGSIATRLIGTNTLPMLLYRPDNVANEHDVPEE
jgi:nucleotide-binding universal stress UspA family protein